jgi:tRNA U34 5-methylaminomethyl-2-thiouridine-forming methyltransferase MnmC
VLESTIYSLVHLTNGEYSLRSLAHRETFHPVIGPVREAESLYVRQLKLPERLENHSGEFVIWDVGLGAAANALTALRLTRTMSCNVRLVSFDCTLSALEFARQNKEKLAYFTGYEQAVDDLLKNGAATFEDGGRRVCWQAHIQDFPSLVASWSEKGADGNQQSRNGIPAPHAIFWDAYSPAKNPAMWCQPLFLRVRRHLAEGQPCALATYSRSTQLRTALLLAGFFVGRGVSTGEKEETTIAATTLDLIENPLDERWLERARNSTSAEPLWEPAYSQKPLEPSTWARLQAHPQFATLGE